jgi:hypothetical protein
MFRPLTFPLLPRTPNSIKNNLNPKWTTTFDLDYSIGRQVRINVGVYDEIRKATNKPMGSAVFEVGEVLGSRGNIRAKRLRQGGTIFCRVSPAPVAGGGGHFVLGLRGIQLKNTGVVSKSDPFFEIQVEVQNVTGQRWQALYRSKQVTNELNPVWPELNLPLDRLGGSSGHEDNAFLRTPLRIRVWDWQKSGRHRSMGMVETTIDSMLGAVVEMDGRANRQVDTSKALHLRHKNKDTGILVITAARVDGGLGGTAGAGSHPPGATATHQGSTAARSHQSDPPPFGQALNNPPLDTMAPLAAALPVMDHAKPPPESSRSSGASAPYAPSAASAPPASYDPSAFDAEGSSYLYEPLPPPMAPPPARPQFVDYISGGCELELCIAIDYTGSNGDPRRPGTLHYLHPDGQLNDYEKALTAVGSIIAKYDSDQKFPVWGFGAKYSGVIHHCFQIGNEPELHGLKAVRDAYRNVFNTGLTMSGPTNLDEVIQIAAAKARSQQQHAQTYGSQAYKILLILTDGAVSDVEATKYAMQSASDAPLSIVIVGIGNADFSAMKFLDDFQTQVGGGRDICQFVEFRRFQNDRSALTQATLEEIPDQLVDYFYTRGINPLPSRRSSQLSLDGVTADDADDEDIDLSIAINEDGKISLANYNGAVYDDTQYNYGTSSLPHATPVPSAPSAPYKQAAPYQPSASYQSSAPAYTPSAAYTPHAGAPPAPVYQPSGALAPASQYNVSAPRPQAPPQHSSYRLASTPSHNNYNVPPPRPQAPSQQPSYRLASPPSAAEIFYVQVPHGVSPGQQLQIRHPRTQQDMIVTIPPGVAPGGKFGVRY